MRGRYVDDIQDAGDWLARNLIAALHRMQGLRALRIIEAESGPPLFSKRLFKRMAKGKLLPALTSLELVWTEDNQPRKYVCKYSIAVPVTLMIYRNTSSVV